MEDKMTASEMTQEDWNNLAKASGVRRYQVGRKMVSPQGKVFVKRDSENIVPADL
jgi:hypothetical protein